MPFTTSAMQTGSPKWSCIISPVSCVISNPPGGGVIKAITDPLGSLNEALRSLANGSLDVFVGYIANPPGYGSQGTLFDIIDGSILGVAEMLVLIAVVIRVGMTLMARHHITNMVHAILILAILSAGGATIFAILDWLQSFGNQLCLITWSVFSGSPKPSSGSLAIPVVMNPVGSIFEIAVILVGGVLLVQTIAIYAMMIPFFKALAPIGLALKPMGERGGKFFDTIVAGLLVMLIVGRTLMVAVLGIAKTLNDSNTPSAPLSATASLVGAFIAALLLQFFAYRWCKKSVAPKISAGLRGTSDTIGSKASSMLGSTAVGAGTAALMSSRGGTAPSDRISQAGGKSNAPGFTSTSLHKGKEAALKAGADKLASRAALHKNVGTIAMKNASASGASKFAAAKVGAAAVGPVGWAVGGAAYIGSKALQHHHNQSVANRQKKEGGGR